MFFQKKIIMLSLMLFMLASCGIKKPLVKPNTLPIHHQQINL